MTAAVAATVMAGTGMGCLKGERGCEAKEIASRGEAHHVERGAASDGTLLGALMIAHNIKGWE